MTILMMVLTILLPAAGALALKLIPGLNADRKRLYQAAHCLRTVSLPRSQPCAAMPSGHSCVWRTASR